MQSLVVGCAVFLIQSMTIASVSSPTGALCLRFFIFGWPFARLGEVGEAGEAASSGAFRFFCDDPATGLPARLPLGIGLVARLPSARGLPLRIPLVRIFIGAFGLVARLATMECPPRGSASPDAGAGVPLAGATLSVAAGSCLTGSSTGSGIGVGSSSSSSDDSSYRTYERHSTGKSTYIPNSHTGSSPRRHSRMHRCPHDHVTFSPDVSLVSSSAGRHRLHRRGPCNLLSSY